MATAATGIVLPGKYSLSELISIENQIVRHFKMIPGISGAGTALTLNRVNVDFVDSAALRRGVVEFASLGIPDDALDMHVTGSLKLFNCQEPTSLPHYVYSLMCRPTEGALMVTVLNRTFQPNDATVAGSLGYNVRNNGTLYLLTAAHPASGFRGRVGVTGDTVFQPNRVSRSFAGKLLPGGPVAIITNNPAWTKPPGCAQDYCITADAMLARYITGATGERKFATSMYEAQGGSFGTADINNFYPIDSVADPAFMREYTLGFHKSGMTTGTTTGTTVIPDYTATFNICLEPAQDPNFCQDQQNDYKTVVFSHFGKVIGGTSRGGDSGGPVYAGNGIPYLALGILSGGNECAEGSAPSDCFFFFSTWANIEAQFGLGSLDPRTSPSDPPPPSGTLLTISGPSLVNDHCLFEINPGSAVPPLTYQWSVDGIDQGSEPSLLFTGNTAYTVEVSVLDANGTQWLDFHDVGISSDADQCGQFQPSG